MKTNHSRYGNSSIKPKCFQVNNIFLRNDRRALKPIISTEKNFLNNNKHQACPIKVLMGQPLKQKRERERGVT